MLNAALYPSAAALLKFVLDKWSSYHWGISCFKNLFSGQFKEWGGCMTELQINFTVFTVSGVLPLSQGLCFLGDWALRSLLSLLQTHGQQMLGGCVPGWYWYPFTILTDVAPFQEFDKHTCGRDHLLSKTSTFLQVAVSWIHGNDFTVGGWGCTTLQILLKEILT